MSKQTAVEWLAEQIKNDQNQKALTPTEWMRAIERAKQMEKEQINKAAYDGYYREGMYDIREYYNETYGK